MQYVSGQCKKQHLINYFSMGSTDNDIYIMIITVTVVLLLLLIFIVSFLFIYRSRQVRHLLEIESVREKYMQEILKTELEIKEQTMKNISEEIHDNVGQILSLVVLNLSQIDPNDSDAAVKIERGTRLVQKAIGDLRNLSKTLNSDNIASLGLMAIIKSELEMLEKTGRYKTALTLSGEEKRVDGNKELVLYRIIQESLNNIIKHARAQCINVFLGFDNNKLLLEISDDGTGFDINNIETKSIYKNGSGINNMKKRAGLIGLSFSIKSTSAEGTTISMTMPLTD
ncbi:MAG: sensor histidine kinase [Bacteroidota bacterium]